MGKGQFKVEASLAADAERVMPKASTREPNQQDLSATRAAHRSRRTGWAWRSQRKAELVVLDERGEAKDRISITQAPVTIGRMSTNDVVLSDPNVSRRHAELQERGRTVVGRRPRFDQRHPRQRKARQGAQLNDGDKISFGTSELIFKSSASQGD